ncbi:N-acetyltransferase GCN5 [Candidatus Protofrankia californiensis]|uniref:N-acetyltransferase GCN5 n=1 Tax=Candidatus Protofrankia californiensis TaxID=1839754 RepID=A0A1C3PH26_9ACTN|nr:N-acetyltransferase GCN5 [Candidatus Protofrankia californiensis]
MPRSVAFPTSPVSPDAVLLMTVKILDDFAGQGLGRILVQAIAKDVFRRGFRAIEAFGDLKGEGARCVVPADYLLAVGFKTVRPHRRWPRLRLEVKNTVSWREDVEVALERLLGSMAPEGMLRQVGSAAGTIHALWLPGRPAVGSSPSEVDSSAFRRLPNSRLPNSRDPGSRG